jgi:hypothetical protein
MFALPKVAKASKEGSFVAQNHWQFCAIGFFMSPVECWFIKAQDTNIYTEHEWLIKTKWN